MKWMRLQGDTVMPSFGSNLSALVMALGLGLGASVVAVGPAQADSTCDILNFTTSTACIAPVPGGDGGNVTADTMNAFGPNGAFGVTGWTQIDKVDRDGRPAADSTALSENEFFQVTYQKPLYKQGLWELVSPFEFDPLNFYAFAIKGSTDNAVYLMNTDFASGSWFVNGLSTPSDRLPDMSNIRLFAAPIPLPPVVFMMLGALGALVVASRRRRTA